MLSALQQSLPRTIKRGRRKGEKERKSMREREREGGSEREQLGVGSCSQASANLI